MSEALEIFRKRLKGLTAAELARVSAELRKRADDLDEEIKATAEHSARHYCHPGRPDFGSDQSSVPN